MAKIMVRMPIEVDVTQVNKTWFSLKKKNKTPRHYVIGFFQRNGNAIIMVLDDNHPETIQDALVKNIQQGAMLYCEENILPESAKSLYKVVELVGGQHSRGDIHVNNVKNIWRDLKRLVKQTHIQVSKKHLQLYCHEVAWKINHQHLSPSEKFELLLSTAAKTVKKGTYEDFIK